MSVFDMERRYYTRLVWLVTCLTTLSFFSVLVTDLNFYLEKIKQKPEWVPGSQYQQISPGIERRYPIFILFYCSFDICLCAVQN